MKRHLKIYAKCYSGVTECKGFFYNVNFVYFCWFIYYVKLIKILIFSYMWYYFFIQAPCKRRIPVVCHDEWHHRTKFSKALMMVKIYFSVLTKYSSYFIQKFDAPLTMVLVLLVQDRTTWKSFGIYNILFKVISK